MNPYATKLIVCLLLTGLKTSSRWERLSQRKKVTVFPASTSKVQRSVTEIVKLKIMRKYSTKKIYLFRRASAPCGQIATSEQV